VRPVRAEIRILLIIEKFSTKKGKMGARYSTRDAYNTRGGSVSGTGSSGQNVTITYDASSTSSGEWFNAKFSFPFIIQKLRLTLGNTNQFGP
jgi:hypothetical protein